MLWKFWRRLLYFYCDRRKEQMVSTSRIRSTNLAECVRFWID
jgi:hypothetical protein